MGLLPAAGFPERNLHHAQIPGLVLRRLGERLGDDPDPEAILLRRAGPVPLVPGQDDRIVVQPAHELPGAAADRMLVEVLRRGARHHGGHRHGEELGEDVERLGQGEDDRRVVRHLDSLDPLGLTLGIGPRAFDRKERPLPPAPGPGVERSEHRAAHLPGTDRPAVVEGGAFPQMEGVDRARAVRLPPGCESRTEPGVGVELDQVVEQQRHHLTRLHVAGDGRVQ